MHSGMWKFIASPCHGILHNNYLSCSGSSWTGNCIKPHSDVNSQVLKLGHIFRLKIIQQESHHSRDLNVAQIYWAGSSLHGGSSTRHGQFYWPDLGYVFLPAVCSARWVESNQVPSWRLTLMYFVLDKRGQRADNSLWLDSNNIPTFSYPQFSSV